VKQSDGPVRTPADLPVCVSAQAGKTAMDLAVYLEQVVRNFSRYHKYTL
jgi:hypothetical protein